MTVAVGVHLGPYEILAPLGAGGMGEVYRARDTRLGREVALKILTAEVAQDAERLRRFEQEARAASAINHANILTVYDFGTASPEAGGAPYLVTELLDGAELRAQLNDGALPVRRAIEYAQQITAGLAAAHEQGITHRDLKPENLFVTKDGRVKILDFGLAKLNPPCNPPVGFNTVTQKQLTNPGTVMGTVAYMSPEQVRGETVDHRSDIFSFGSILYEMLSGQRAFQRETAAETMTAILKEDAPELSAANSKIAPGLEKLVRRCLEKQPERRFHSAHDLTFALEAVATPSGAHLESVMVFPAVTAGKWQLLGNARLAWLTAGLLGLVALLALVAPYFKRSAPEMRAVRLAFVPSDNVAYENASNDRVVVSPDGQRLVFTGRSPDGKKQLYVRSLDATEATLLPGTEEPFTPFWSPDSRSVGFGSQGKLKRIDVAGGRVQTLCDASRLFGGTWSRDGVILFAPDQRPDLHQISATGGEPKPVTGPDPARRDIGHHDPHFLPDGRHFLFGVAGRDGEQGVFAGSLDSKEVKPVLLDAAYAVYAPPGWLLFVRNGGLLTQAFDAVQLELKGEAVPLVRPDGGVRFSASENGVLIWQGNQESDYQLAWFDRAGKQVGAVGPQIRTPQAQNPRLSPDEKRIVINRTDPQTRNRDIWVIDLARDLPIRLTADPAVDQRPIWSPDGSQVVYARVGAEEGGLYKKAASGAGTEEWLLQRGGYGLSDWSADGRFIIFHQRTQRARLDVRVLPLAGDRRPYPILDSEFDECEPKLSPDGRWLAYVSDESGSYEVYVQAFTAEGKLGGDKARISTSGGNYPSWQRKGQELFYIAPDWQMMAVLVKTSGASFAFGTPKSLFKTRQRRAPSGAGNDYDVTADGQHFLIGTQVGEANTSPVSVILNWTAGLPR